MQDHPHLDTELEQTITSFPTRGDVQAALDRFAAHSGLPPLTLGEDGTARRMVDDDLLVTFVHFPRLPGIVVAAPLPVEAIKSSTVLRGLLQANMHWQATSGGCLMCVPPALDPMLCCLIPVVAIDAEETERRFEAFLDCARMWTEEIELHLDLSTDSDPAPDHHRQLFDQLVGRV